MAALPTPNSFLARAVLGVIALAVASVALLPATADASSPGVSVYDSLAVLRPDRPAPAGSTSSATLSAAQNEAESFQIFVQTGSAVDGLTVAPGDALTGPGGATIPASAMTFYREGYYNVGRRSDAEGATGSWPDVLVPAVDDLYGETRNAFPINVGSGVDLAAWIDVLVPSGQTPGAYHGSVVVTSTAGTLATVPVAMTVEPFRLPSTSTLTSAFFTDAGQICAAFTGDDNCNGDANESWQLESLFAEVGLDNRVTIANPVPSTPAGSLFSEYVAPLIEGTDPKVDLPGARLTSIEAYGPTCAVKGSSCLSQWKSAADEYNFASRFFLYNCDEPSDPSAWAQCQQNADIANSQWPGVRKLVTATGDDVAKENAGYTDIVAPVVNYSDPAPAGGGKEKWMYTSCMSFSCDSSESSADNGWPGYAIDQPASQARSMGWVAFAYKATGELYWNTTASLPTAQTNQYVSGGNGDGNLFYAGTPDGGHGSIAIGGTHDIPLESIRLKRIRDGREDYEYLHILQAEGRAGAADTVVSDLFGSSPANHTTVSGAALGAARDRLAELIGGGGGAPTKKDLHVQVLRIKVPHSAVALRRHGVRALVSCTVACRIDLGSKVTHRAARRLGVHTTKIVAGSKRLGANRREWVTARLTPHARSSLVDNKKSTRVHLRPELHSKRI